MKPVRLLLTLSILGIGLQMMASDPPPRERMWEYLINERVMDYPLKTENLFRLAVYTELKGNYMPTEDALALDFVPCDQPAWTLLGVSLAGFNALFSLGGAITIWVLLLAKDKPGRSAFA